MSQSVVLLPGESPIPHAPLVQLDESAHCIPQHYLTFAHTLASVEKMVLDVQYSDKYPVFVCEDATGLYIQVGIVGYDNYRPKDTQPHAKIVYGRKWRVEPQLPTSEILQTVYLALIKAREHEVRELFRLTHDGKTTSPFSNHHDLPLMAQQAKRLTTDAEQALVSEQTLGRLSVEWLLTNVSYDAATITLTDIEQRRNGKWILDMSVNASVNTSLPELKSAELSLVVDSLNTNELLYQLMDALLGLSHSHVEEHFFYRGFARFSRSNSVLAIGELSSITRQRESSQLDDAFSHIFSEASYDTDKTRVPKLNNGELSAKIRQQLTSLNVLEGILPF